MSNLSTLPKGDSAWLLRKAIERIMEQVSVLETNIGSSTTGNSANTQVIFNDNGTLRGDAGLVYNKTTDALTVAGLVTAGSATITGDLTVDSSTLKVDSTNDVVGIGTTTPNSYAFNDPAKLVIANTGTAGAGNTFTIASGSTGFGQIAFANGTSGTDRSNGYIKYSHSTNAMEFYTTAGTLQATLNSTGLGIGVSPSQRLHVKLDQNAYTYSRIDNQNASSGAYAALMLAASGNSWGIGVGSTAANSNALDFFLDAGGANSVKMTLDASGYLLLGTTDTTFTSGAGYKFGPGATPSNGQVGASSSNGDLTLRVYSTGAAAYRFYVGFGGTVFATSATISAISDARLKENVQDIDVGLSAILSLKPRKFDWKAGKGKDIKGDRGFIAQEFETVFPNLIDEWADPAPGGEAPYKSVRQDLIPVLVKAIQELTARVQTLEAR